MKRCFPEKLSFHIWCLVVSFCLLACLRRQISVRPLVRTVAVAVLLPSLLGFPHNRHQDFLTNATKISLLSPPRFPYNRHQDFLIIGNKISLQSPQRFLYNRHQDFLKIATKISSPSQPRFPHHVRGYLWSWTFLFGFYSLSFRFTL